MTEQSKPTLIESLSQFLPRMQHAEESTDGPFPPPHDLAPEVRGAPVPVSSGHSFYDADDHPGMLDEALPPFAWNTWKSVACQGKSSAMHDAAARRQHSGYQYSDHPGMVEEALPPFAWNTWKNPACARAQ